MYKIIITLIKFLKCLQPFSQEHTEELQKKCLFFFLQKNSRQAGERISEELRERHNPVGGSSSAQQLDTRGGDYLAPKGQPHSEVWPAPWQRQTAQTALRAAQPSSAPEGFFTASFEAALNEFKCWSCVPQRSALRLLPLLFINSCLH